MEKSASGGGERDNKPANSCEASTSKQVESSITNEDLIERFSRDESKIKSLRKFLEDVDRKRSSRQPNRDASSVNVSSKNTTTTLEKLNDKSLNDNEKEKFKKALAPSPESRSDDNNARNDNIKSALNDNKKNQSQTDDTLDQGNAETDIVRAFGLFEKAVSNLPRTEKYTPTFETILTLCKLLNTKLSNSRARESFNSTISFEHDIEIIQIPGKDEVLVGRKIILKASKFAWAIKASEPKLIVSRIIRSCISNEIKKNCSVVNKDPDSRNFSWRFGDESLKGMERVKDGQTKVDMIIELAHKEKNQKMSEASHRDCLYQVKKACDDYNRIRIKGLANNCQNNTLEEKKSDNIQHEQDSSTRIPAKKMKLTVNSLNNEKKLTNNEGQNEESLDFNFNLLCQLVRNYKESKNMDN